MSLNKHVVFTYSHISYTPSYKHTLSYSTYTVIFHIHCHISHFTYTTTLHIHSHISHTLTCTVIFHIHCHILHTLSYYTYTGIFHMHRHISHTPSYFTYTNIHCHILHTLTYTVIFHISWHKWCRRIGAEVQKRKSTVKHVYIYNNNT